MNTCAWSLLYPISPPPLSLPTYYTVYLSISRPIDQQRAIVVTQKNRPTFIFTVTSQGCLFWVRLAGHLYDCHHVLWKLWSVLRFTANCSCQTSAVEEALKMMLVSTDPLGKVKPIWTFRAHLQHLLDLYTVTATGHSETAIRTRTSCMTMTAMFVYMLNRKHKRFEECEGVGGYNWRGALQPSYHRPDKSTPGGYTLVPSLSSTTQHLWPSTPQATQLTCTQGKAYLVTYSTDQTQIKLSPSLTKF